MQQKQLFTTLGIIGAVLLVIWAVRAYRQGRINRLINPGGSGTPSNGGGLAQLDYTRILGIGTRGAEVSELQRLLNEDGARPALTVDGIFGPLTQAALLAEKNQDEITLNQYGANRNNLTTANGLPNGSQNLAPITTNIGGMTGQNTMPGTFL